VLLALSQDRFKTLLRHLTELLGSVRAGLFYLELWSGAVLRTRGPWSLRPEIRTSNADLHYSAFWIIQSQAKSLRPTGAPVKERATIDSDLLAQPPVIAWTGNRAVAMVSPFLSLNDAKVNKTLESHLGASDWWRQSHRQGDVERGQFGELREPGCFRTTKHQTGSALSTI